MCGLPYSTASGQTSCDTCLGKNSIYVEGVIFKKQKKNSEKLKKYWYVLLGKELYTYRSKSDSKHKEMKSLAGVYLKDEPDTIDEQGNNLFLFMLIFPNKRSIYYLTSQEDK